MTSSSISEHPTRLDLDIRNPRVEARRRIHASIPSEIRIANESHVESILAFVKSHDAWNNSAIDALRGGKVSRPDLWAVHMDYRHAIVEIFTDVILMAQFQTRQLDAHLGRAAKMPPRFLLTLNLLDELGFSAGYGSGDYFQGHPDAAHAGLFDRVVAELAAPGQGEPPFTPSDAAGRIRTFVEQAYDDLVMLLAVLLVTEESALVISPSLRLASAAVGLNVDSGYYLVHGSSEDPGTNAFDDDHQLDIVALLAQAMTPERHESTMATCRDYCELWSEFWRAQDRRWSKG